MLRLSIFSGPSIVHVKRRFEGFYIKTKPNQNDYAGFYFTNSNKWNFQLVRASLNLNVRIVKISIYYCEYYYYNLHFKYYIVPDKCAHV